MKKQLNHFTAKALFIGAVLGSISGALHPHDLDSFYGYNLFNVITSFILFPLIYFKFDNHCRSFIKTTTFIIISLISYTIFVQLLWYFTFENTILTSMFEMIIASAIIYILLIPGLKELIRKVKIRNQNL